MIQREPRRNINPTLYKSDFYTNPEIYEVLPDGAWSGRECFIVGGGPSLKNFDWSRLKGKRTIGVNLAFTKFEPTIIFSMDTRFLRWIERGNYGDDVRNKFLAARSYKVWNCTYVASLPKYIYIIKTYKDYNAGLMAFTENLKQGIGHGNNSGYAAINFAYCLGANPIFLLGFDCKHENGRSHWHNGHPVKQREATVFNFIKHFQRIAPHLRAQGVRVINLNPDSGLNCFEKAKPDKYL